MYNSNIQFEVKFEIKRITYRKDDSRYSIVIGKILDSTYPEPIPSEIVIQGTFASLIKGDVFKGIGEFVLNQTYGWSIKLRGVPITVVPQIKKGISEFIKSRIKGLGIKTAEKIVDTLGLEAITMIEKDYECLLKIPGITEKRAIKIQERLIDHRRFEDIAMFVQANNMECDVAIKIYEAFKDDSIKMVKENPYIICNIPKLDFTQADIFAYNLAFPFDNYERVKSAIIYYINYFMKNYGDICIFKDELFSKFSAFIIKLGAFTKEEAIKINISVVEKALQELVMNDRIVTEINEDDRICLYRKDYNVIENNIINNLKKLLSNGKKPFCIKEDIDDFINQYEADNFKLANNQKKAVYMALTNGLSILTGGPGTGKTQTTNTIVKCIRNIKPYARIVLLAPTGKASRRMTELTNMDASTIHRGIGLNGFNSVSELEEIDADFVIVDESSMIDAYMFNALISNISENTRLIFVGDSEQLPSVGPGLILRDLINSGRIPVTILDKIFRQAENSQIVMNSHRIIKGNKRDLTFDNSKGDFYFIPTKDKLKIKENIIQSIKNLIANKGYFLSDICILSPMRKGEIGVNELNRTLQRTFNPPSSKPDYDIDNMNVFRVGDRVMQSTNNYDLNVMNGDVGEIMNIYYYERDLMIDVQYFYKDEPVSYAKSDISELELAYAITVHKSQGSEFPVVIMPISDTHEKMLNRNLIYTGITRAKKTVILIGSKHTLYRAMDKGEVVNRNSKIKEKIQKEIT